MQSRELRAGLVGAGDIGSYLGKICNEIEGVSLVSIAGRKLKKIQDYARKYEAIPYDNYQQMLGEAKLDALIVATPSSTHPIFVLSAIEHGINVFCEKPMALSIDDCDQMIDNAVKKNVKLMVGHVLREMSPFRDIRVILEKEQFGKPLFASLVRAEKMDLWGWYYDVEQYKSVFHEITIHEMDFLRTIFGEVEKIKVTYVHRPGHNLDYDSPTQVQMAFKKGGIGFLNQHFNSPLSIGCGSILCENGSLRYTWRDGNKIEYLINGGEKVCIEISESDDNNGYRRELSSFFDWIRSDKPPCMTAEDGRAAVEIAEGAYLSRKNGKTVILPLSGVN